MNVESPVAAAAHKETRIGLILFVAFKMAKHATVDQLRSLNFSNSSVTSSPETEGVLMIKQKRQAAGA